MNSADSKLLNDIRDLAEDIRRAEEPIIVLTHYDGDGLCAGAATLRYLYKLGKYALIRSTHTLNNIILEEFFELHAKTYIIQDMGSGDLNQIYNIWMSKGTSGSKLYVIDHHKILAGEVLSRILENESIRILNPELYGLDGGKIGCTSILTSLIGYYGLNEEDVYMLEIGLIGSTSDMQLQNEVYSINKHLLDLAVKRDVVEVRDEFIFFTNRKLPIFKAIVWNLVPYIPGFSGRDDVGLNIVRKAGIRIRRRDGSFMTVEDLNDEERERLLGIILQYVSSLGIQGIKSDDFITRTYILKLEDNPYLKTTVDFSNLVSACGRMDREAIGIVLAAGARGEVLEEALKIFEERRRILSKYLEYAESNIRVLDGLIAVIDFRGLEFNVKFSGTISTIFSRALPYLDKIIIVLAEDPIDKSIKISARAPKELVSKGFNLAIVMKKLADLLGGRGGGHNVAAGASIPIERSNEIIDHLVNIIKSRLK